MLSAAMFFAGVFVLCGCGGDNGGNNNTNGNGGGGDNGNGNDVVQPACSVSECFLSTGALVLDGVYFESGKSELHINSKPYIGTIAYMLVKYSRLNIEIGRYTDNTKSATIGQEHADAVYNRYRPIAFSNALVQGLRLYDVHCDEQAVERVAVD
jgi:hypothetical protein